MLKINKYRILHLRKPSAQRIANFDQIKLNRYIEYAYNKTVYVENIANYLSVLFAFSYTKCT